MTSPDLRDPRPPSEPFNPGFIIAGVVFVVVLLFGALFGGFLRDLPSGHTAAIPKGNRLEFAEQAFQGGDNETAAKIFSELAEKNNGIAQYWLAHMTELGLGVPRDPPKAIELYKKAAMQEVAAAERRLGEIYLHGDLVPPDFKQAKSYLERAAYHGDARAAMQLSQMYHLGLGMPADPIEAYAWSEVASLEGNISARRERDASLRDLKESNQQQAVTRADEIQKQIKRETSPPRPPS